jgi:acyl carrier protein
LASTLITLAKQSGEAELETVERTVEETILAYLAKAVGEAGGTATVAAQTGLLETGILDSIGLVGLIQFIEARFGLQIPDADLTPELFETPASVAEYVARRVG